MARISIWVAGVAAFSSATVHASPWTLKRGELVLTSAFDVQFADREFLEEGGERVFPLNGRFFAAGLTLSARLGITDRIELEASVPLRFVGYQSDPAILQRAPPGLGDAEALGFFQESIVDFSQSGAGIADITLRGRYQYLNWGRLVSALQFSITTPTGYDPPEGTFGLEPTTIEAFLSDEANLVRPQNVRDDVALGDGVLELEPAVLVGVALGSGTFARASAAYALRLGGAGDQVRADLRIGQGIGARVLLYLSGRLAVTVEDGDLIGISVVARDPNTPAVGFIDGGTRLLPRPLERDALDVGGGFVWKTTDAVEMNFSLQRTIWGRFTAATWVGSLNFVFRTRT
ncbi:MAG: hypothetical protein AAFZ18_39610 [Myxococcota bacterium]